jgi:peptide deformylase
MPESMPRLILRHYPDPVLRQPAEPIEQVTDEVRAVADRMIEFMHQHQGVGLSGPQVGLGWRIFVANPTLEPGQERVFINPVLHEPARQTEARDEGCLSLPDIVGQVTRPVSVTLDALDREGRPFQLTGADFTARVWQHEQDHLDGILIIDRMPPFERNANKKILRQLEEMA